MQICKTIHGSLKKGVRIKIFCPTQLISNLVPTTLSTSCHKSMTWTRSINEVVDNLCSMWRIIYKEMDVNKHESMKQMSILFFQPMSFVLGSLCSTGTTLLQSSNQLWMFYNISIRIPCTIHFFFFFKTKMPQDQRSIIISTKTGRKHGPRLLLTFAMTASSSEKLSLQNISSRSSSSSISP